MSADQADPLLLDGLFAVREVLAHEHIDHAVCGGIAANLYRQELRTTTDVDVYIICSPTELVALTRAFERAGWKAHPAWRQAELLRLEQEDLPRVDLLIATTEFERAAVERAIPFEMRGQEVRVLVAEDLIVFKLVAGRLRDYEAVAAIINTNGDALDDAYIRRSLAELGMEERWPRAVEGAKLEAQDLG